jgi:hypothetical protein
MWTIECVLGGRGCWLRGLGVGGGARPAVLGVTQPVLFNGVAALEHTLGGPLFHRSTTGVTPTPLAVRVLPDLEAHRIPNNGVLQRPLELKRARGLVAVSQVSASRWGIRSR